MNKTTKITVEKPETKRNNKVSLVQKKERLKTKAVPAVDQILSLQSTIGNQAVQRLLKSGTLQAKLRIGKPDDKYEREADMIADKVMRMPEMTDCLECKDNAEESLQTKPITTQITPLVRRQAEEEEEEAIQGKFEPSLLQKQDEEEEEEPIQAKLEPSSLQRQIEPEEEEEGSIQTKSNSSSIAEISSSVESNINSLKGGGHPLSESTRKYFEPRFGYDFKGVRVHTDSKASETAKSINAKAFTKGRNIVFGAGKYSPTTSTGKKLLAHELTHVVQQNTIRPVRRKTEESVRPLIVNRTKESIQGIYYNCRNFKTRRACLGGAGIVPTRECINRQGHVSKCVWPSGITVGCVCAGDRSEPGPSFRERARERVGRVLPQSTIRELKDRGLW